MVNNKWFATIERSLLEVVVVRDTLTIEEIELFKAVDLWATKACERQGLAADGASKRRIVGEHVIKGIRFPTMKLEELSSVVLDSDILTKEESNAWGLPRVLQWNFQKQKDLVFNLTVIFNFWLDLTYCLNVIGIAIICAKIPQTPSVSL